MFSLFRVAHAIYFFTNCCNHQVKLFFFQWYQYIVNAKKNVYLRKKHIVNFELRSSLNENKHNYDHHRNFLYLDFRF